MTVQGPDIIPLPRSPLPFLQTRLTQLREAPMEARRPEGSDG